MLLLDNLLLGPGKAALYVFQQLARKAQEEWLDDDAVKQELQEIYALVEAGKMNDQEFEARECQLLERLEQIARAKYQDKWGSDQAAAALPDVNTTAVVESTEVVAPAAELEQPPAPAPTLLESAFQQEFSFTIAPLMIPTDDAAPPPVAPAPALPLPASALPDFGTTAWSGGADGVAPPTLTSTWPPSGASPFSPPVAQPAFVPPVAAAPFAPSVAPAPFAPTVAASPPITTATVTAPSAPGLNVCPALNIGQVIESARRALAMLNLRVSAISSVAPIPEGWRVTIELLERRSVPDTSDLLGVYEVYLDAAGTVLRYERTRIRRRSDIGR